VNARNKKRSNARRLAVAVFAVVLLACLAGAVYKGATDPRLALTGIAVAGENRTSPSEILLAAGMPRGANVWLLDTAAAESRVESLPWIDTVRISRAWPNRVSVVVSERAPVARVLLPNGGDAEEPTRGFALIDASLRVVAVGAADDQAATLPVFRIEPQPVLALGADASGSDVAHAYDVMVQLRALGLRISEVDLKPTTGVTVTCDGGLRVILGTDDDFARKVSLFKAIAPKIAAPQDVVYVDLRSVRAPTVLYR
jgi:cell division protein FtsQ